ncbi:cytochrome c [Acidobacteria bacterium AB60]|nr:cytochrome c [Acidobacteria bacterium AB60]
MTWPMIRQGTPATASPAASFRNSAPVRQQPATIVGCGLWQAAFTMKSMRLGVSSAFAMALAFSGCRPASLNEQQMEGRTLYEGRCAHCHRDNDLALKKVPPDLHEIFRHTALPSGAPANDAEVQKVILYGKGMMPAFAGRFTQEQMSALLAYLHTGLR